MEERDIPGVAAVQAVAGWASAEHYVEGYREGYRWNWRHGWLVERDGEIAGAAASPSELT
jgi:hypothetical protein